MAAVTQVRILVTAVTFWIVVEETQKSSHNESELFRPVVLKQASVV